MSNLLRQITAVLMGTAFLGLGHGLFQSLVGLHMLAEGFSPSSIGWVASAFYVGAVFGVLHAARVIRSIGHPRVFAALGGLLACVTLSHVLVASIGAWVVLRIAGGYCFAALLVTVESWINAVARPATRGRLLASYMVVTLASVCMGQLFLELGDTGGTQLFVVASMMFCVALVPVALTRMPEPEAVPLERLDTRRLFRRSPIGVAGCFVAGLTLPAFYTLGAVAARGMDMPHVSSFLACTLAGGLAFQWPLGSLSDRFDRRLALLGSAVVAAAVAACLCRFDLSLPAVRFALAFALGGPLFAIYPIGVALVNDCTRPDEVVDVSRGLLLVFCAGGALAPMTGAVALELLGGGGLFFQIAAVCLAFATVAMAVSCTRRGCVQFTTTASSPYSSSPTGARGQ